MTGRPARRSGRVATVGVGALVAMASVGLLFPGPAAAQVETPSPAPEPAIGQGLSAEVAAVPATSAALDAAEADLEELQDRITSRQGDLDRTVAELAAVDGELAAVTGLAGRRAEQITKSRGALRAEREHLRALASEWFVSGFGTMESLDPTLGADEVQDLQTEQVLAESLTDAAMAAEAALRRRVGALERERRDLVERRDGLSGRSAALGARRDELTAGLARDRAAVPVAEERVTLARLNATVDGTDLSTIALDAYWRAARRLSVERAGCRVPWWALAGIGRTESRHGTYGGGQVGVDGRVTVPILGPPLDGSNGFAVIRDSDGGGLDGTASTDRAVGPMQFLPSTWRSLGRDATGDGTADPQNIYDAALTAGEYLCRSGPGLDQEPRLRRAYYSYNHSNSYVDVVVGHATGYAAAVPLR